MTPQPIVAKVSYVVTSVTDRITGDRNDYPLLVSASIQYALKKYHIQSNIFYGPSAWVEILENHIPVWAGCWGEFFNFWVATQFGEIVDLNLSVSYRKRSHSNLNCKPLYSPPMVWSKELPRFYRYKPEGIAELELNDPRDIRWFDLIKKEIDRHCSIELQSDESPLQYPNEPILCSNRQVLDDSKNTFKKYDRALSVHGIPEAPF
jgi:hypothetical protein